MSADTVDKPVPPIRMAQAMRAARRIYTRNVWQVVLLYAVIMAVPTAVNVPIAAHFFDAPSIEEFFREMEPGSANYLPFAFNGMLTALLYPIAAAATIVLLRNVIATRHARFRESFREVLRLWLTITQFGLLWYIVLRIGAQAASPLYQMTRGGGTLHVTARVVLIATAAVLLAWWFFAYVAALVKIVVDRCDPLRAAVAGSRLALRHMRGFFAIAWRVAVVYAIYFVGIAVTLVAIKKENLGGVMLLIVPSIVMTPFLVITLGLYLLDRLYREEHDEARSQSGAPPPEPPSSGGEGLEPPGPVLPLRDGPFP
ncbi:MAG TPA: hypothetical protein VGU66_14365 [Candidatus Elarobacter sp.]|nr:hypothetical protein [Candidatus Elarobacter sp.]